MNIFVIYQLSEINAVLSALPNKEWEFSYNRDKINANGRGQKDKRKAKGKSIETKNKSKGEGQKVITKTRAITNITGSLLNNYLVIQD